MARNERGKAYYVLYVDAIDATCHRYGPNSVHLAADIEAFLAVMENVF